MTKEEMAIALICSLEGCKLQAYRCPAGIWTIGYGSTFKSNGDKVKEGDSCTLEEAKKFLYYHLVKRVFPFVNALCKGFDVPDRVYAALCSIAYNIGAGLLKNDSFVIPVSKLDWGTLDESNYTGTGLAATFLMYVKMTVDGQRVLSLGLKNRRVKEIKYFLDI